MSDAQSPIHAQDQRLRTRLQEIRAKTWIAHVMAVSGLNNPYQLDQCFDGGQGKWKRYQNGKMPNERTVETVEQANPGTRDWLERGPNGLALWPALGHWDIEVVQAIANRSSKIDGDFAQLRLDAAMNLIEVEFPLPPKFDADGHYIPDFRWPPVWFDEKEMAGDDYVGRQQVILYDLTQMGILSDEVCGDIAHYFYELLQPYRIRAYRKKFEDFYDAVVDTRLTFSAGRAAEEDARYFLARMESIGNQGSRPDND
jgi:hypothetical protein